MLLSINPEILLAAFAILCGLTYSMNSLLLNLIERKRTAVKIQNDAEGRGNAADLS